MSNPFAGYDQWKTTPPDEASESAWEFYVDDYGDKAIKVIFDNMVQNGMPNPTPEYASQFREYLKDLFVDYLDWPAVFKWAIDSTPDYFPTFEQYLEDLRQPQ